MWEGRESEGRSRGIEKHPQHSKPNKEHGELDDPSGQKVAPAGIPRLDAIAGGLFHGGAGGVDLHCCKSSIGVPKLVSLTSFSAQRDCYIYTAHTVVCLWTT